MDPSRILQVAFGFWPAKTLLTAVELDLFTVLASADGLTAFEVSDRLGLRSRAVTDFLDALVALGFLRRVDNGPQGTYHNSDATAVFLDRRSPRSIAGLLEMTNARLYPFWANLTDALRTGHPQSEASSALFDVLYADDGRAEGVQRAMAALSAENAAMLADAFDFGRYGSLCDAGGATGQLAITVANRHPHLRCATVDLPAIEPYARRAVADAGLTDRVAVVSADLFTDPLPSAEVVTMSLVLHDWNLYRKLHLIRSAHAALPPGGAYIVVENMIDDDRRVNASALMSSLNMLVEFGDGFEFTVADLSSWCHAVGFEPVATIPLAGTVTAAVFVKTRSTKRRTG